MRTRLLLAMMAFLADAHPAASQDTTTSFGVGIRILGGAAQVMQNTSLEPQPEFAAVIDRNAKWSPQSRFTCNGGRRALEIRLTVRLIALSCKTQTYRYSGRIEGKTCLVNFDPHSGGYAVHCT